MIGVVLENIHQFRRLQEELSLMESVHRIITAVAGERDLRDLCGETVRLLRDNTRYNFVEVYEVLSRITGEVRMIGGGAEEDGSCREQEDLLRERGWGLVGLAARTGRLVNVPDVRDSPQYVPIKRTTRSELDVPIEFGGNLYGILSLESDIPGAFTEDDERAMSILSGHLGVLWAHRELLDRTERQAMQDPLTGLWNRRFIFGRLDAEIARCERYGCRFSIAMIDLVNFKSVNDRFGHTTGDRVLAETGSFFARSLRACDMVARYGGDEFLVLLPEADLDEAMCIVERLLERCRGLTFCGGEVQVSFDFGIASFPADGRDSGSLVRKADENLYGRRGIITRPEGG
ncbi:MAG: Diguanylate cyclase with GAF sensor [Synergistales bacterium 57_84]|nr:MAG: Diguanylate cyclase with GAF sensor [Synergistales bacterium 57_84]